MAKFHGKNTKVYIWDTAWRDVSGDVTSVEIGGQADTVDVAGFGAASKTYVVGLTDGQIRIQASYNDTATTGIHQVLSDQVGSILGIRIGPGGSAAGTPGYLGSVILSEYSVSSGIGAAVSVTANLVPESTTPPVWGTI